MLLLQVLSVIPVFNYTCTIFTFISIALTHSGILLQLLFYFTGLIYLHLVRFRS